MVDGGRYAPGSCLGVVVVIIAIRLMLMPFPLPPRQCRFMVSTMAGPCGNGQEGREGD